MLEREGLALIKLAFLRRVGRSKPYTIIYFLKKKHKASIYKILSRIFISFPRWAQGFAADGHHAEAPHLPPSGGSTVRLLHVVKAQHESKRSVIYMIRCEALILTFTALTAVKTDFPFSGVLFKFSLLSWLTNTSREREEHAFQIFAISIFWEVSAFIKLFCVKSQTRPLAKG